MYSFLRSKPVAYGGFSMFSQVLPFTSTRSRDHLMVQSRSYQIQSKSDLPAAQACVAILIDLYSRIMQTGDEFRETPSPESLHAYRISLRKTRSLLVWLDGVFPEPGLSRFRKEFASIMQRTGPLRDLEICNEALIDYKTSHSKAQGSGIDVLCECVEKLIRAEHISLLNYLDSAGYARRLQGWYFYLQEMPVNDAALERASCPSQLFANEVVRRGYRRVLGQGAVTGRKLSSGSLHKLRKSCKKLRYILEIFADLLPDKKRKSRIRALKSLQQILGKIQDTEVQLRIVKRCMKDTDRESLAAYRKDVKPLRKTLKRKKRRLKTRSGSLIRKFIKDSAGYAQS